MKQTTNLRSTENAENVLESYKQQNSWKISDISDLNYYLPFTPATILHEFDGQDHLGIDIEVPFGSPVTAMIDGTVEAITTDENGINVSVRHADGTNNLSNYCHLSSLAGGVEIGSYVSQEIAIGASGQTQNGSNRLHLELLIDGLYVNPRSSLRFYPESILSRMIVAADDAKEMSGSNLDEQLVGKSEPIALSGLAGNDDYYIEFEPTGNFCTIEDDSGEIKISTPNGYLTLSGNAQPKTNSAGELIADEWTLLQGFDLKRNGTDLLVYYAGSDLSSDQTSVITIKDYNFDQDQATFGFTLGKTLLGAGYDSKIETLTEERIYQGGPLIKSSDGESFYALLMQDTTGAIAGRRFVIGKIGSDGILTEQIDISSDFPITDATAPVLYTNPTTGEESLAIPFTSTSSDGQFTQTKIGICVVNGDGLQTSQVIESASSADSKILSRASFRTQPTGNHFEFTYRLRTGSSFSDLMQKVLLSDLEKDGTATATDQTRVTFENPSSLEFATSGNKVTLSSQVLTVDLPKLRDQIGAEIFPNYVVSSGEYTASETAQKSVLSIDPSVQEEDLSVAVPYNHNSTLVLMAEPAFQSGRNFTVKLPVDDLSEAFIYSTDLTAEQIFDGEFTIPDRRVLTPSQKDAALAGKDGDLAMQAWQEAIGDDYTLDLRNISLTEGTQKSTVIVLPNNQKVVLVGSNATEIEKSLTSYFAVQDLIAPTVSPSGQPSITPSTAPSSYPSLDPSATPSVEPSSSPSATPAAAPSFIPTMSPNPDPSGEPSFLPSPLPTHEPSGQPTRAPMYTYNPSTHPSVVPIGHPSSLPTNTPTYYLTQNQSGQPTLILTRLPSGEPTSLPTVIPSAQPGAEPTYIPSNSPTTLTPSSQPSFRPSLAQTNPPSSSPSVQPSAKKYPSAAPTSAVSPSSEPTSGANPSSEPTKSAQTSQPSFKPINPPSSAPSFEPSAKRDPSAAPTSAVSPSSEPTSGVNPSSAPTVAQTDQQSSSPSVQPSAKRDPSAAPTSGLSPSSEPTSGVNPSSAPTKSAQTSQPSFKPINPPSSAPSFEPSAKRDPSAAPTSGLSPSSEPTSGANPSSEPTKSVQTNQPSSDSINPPSSAPSFEPSAKRDPSAAPTSAASPSSEPSSGANPSSEPTKSAQTSQPSFKPINPPSSQPSSSIPAPNLFPTIAPTPAPVGQTSNGESNRSQPNIVGPVATTITSIALIAVMARIFFRLRERGRQAIGRLNLLSTNNTRDESALQKETKEDGWLALSTIYPDTLESKLNSNNPDSNPYRSLSTRRDEIGIELLGTDPTFQDTYPDALGDDHSHHDLTSYRSLLSRDDIELELRKAPSKEEAEDYQQDPELSGIYTDPQSRISDSNPKAQSKKEDEESDKSREEIAYPDDFQSRHNPRELPPLRIKPSPTIQNQTRSRVSPINLGGKDVSNPDGKDVRSL
jgi:hypothetical protein